MKTFFTVFILTILFLTVSNSALAGRKQEVLGVATPASQINFPDVTSGPGFFLPNSPLFFLDQTFQTLRLASKFNALDRARTHASIAGERLAELRIMFEQEDMHAIEKTLTLLTKEMGQSATKLSEAESRGASKEDVENLAAELNEIVKNQRAILSQIESQTQDSLSLQIKTARQQLREAKLEIEDHLDEAALSREIQEGLEEDVDETLNSAENALETLSKDIEKLKFELAQAQARRLSQREELLQNAIEQKEAQLKDNTQLQKQEQDNDLIESQELEDALESAELAKEQLEAIRKVVEQAQQLGKQGTTFSD